MTNLAANLPVVVADPTQMEQIFLNLLVNACDAMPDGGRIDIVSRHDAAQQEVWVSVGDTGHGISSEILSHIFEPFFSTKNGKSTGLGLAVSQGIVRQYAGRLEVESEEGQGSTFRVVMPAAHESGTTSSPS